MDLFYFAVKGFYRFAPFSFILIMLIGSGLNPFKKSPQTAKDYVNRAEQHLITNDFQLALADYNQALKLNPNFPEAYARRGELYLSRSRYLERFNTNDEAAKKIAQQLHLDSSQSPALQKAGIADYRQAQTLYQEQGRTEYSRQLSRQIALFQQGKTNFVETHNRY